MGQFGRNLGDTNVTDPREAKWGDLDTSEKGARLFAGGMRGLGQGLQRYGGEAPPMGGGQINPMQFAGSGRVDPAYFQPSRMLPNMGGGRFSLETPEDARRRLENSAFSQPQRRGPNDIAFYGGYGSGFPNG